MRASVPSTCRWVHIPETRSTHRRTQRCCRNRAMRSIRHHATGPDPVCSAPVPKVSTGSRWLTERPRRLQVLQLGSGGVIQVAGEAGDGVDMPADIRPARASCTSSRSAHTVARRAAASASRTERRPRPSELVAAGSQDPSEASREACNAIRVRKLPGRPAPAAPAPPTKRDQRGRGPPGRSAARRPMPRPRSRQRHCSYGCSRSQAKWERSTRRCPPSPAPLVARLRAKIAAQAVLHRGHCDGLSPA